MASDCQITENLREKHLMELSSRAAKAWEAISVFANSEVDRKSTRATSRATFPWTWQENC